MVASSRNLCTPPKSTGVLSCSCTHRSLPEHMQALCTSAHQHMRQKLASVKNGQLRVKYIQVCTLFQPNRRPRVVWGAPSTIQPRRKAGKSNRPIPYPTLALGAPSRFQPKARRAPSIMLSMSGWARTAAWTTLCSRINSSRVGIGIGLRQQATLVSLSPGRCARLSA